MSPEPARYEIIEGLAPWQPADALSGAEYSAAELSVGDDCLFLMDQRELPAREIYVAVRSSDEASRAIRDMVVRGAPAIGITAAYGLVLAARDARAEAADGYRTKMRRAAEYLEAARPTAVNLAWAVRRMSEIVIGHAASDGEARVTELAREARRIHREDVEACRAMGRAGAASMPDEGVVLTHCNAGALATGGYGTALGVIRAGIEAGKRIRVLADETRPYLQGARLTSWELSRDGVDVEVIADSMAAHFMARGEVKAVVVGADRIARNGDAANKIGTYGLACVAAAHDVPFYVAAPRSTIDWEAQSGADIPIEERSREEMVRCGDRVVVPDGVGARHPAFDVTPARLIRSIFTEMGAVEPSMLAAASWAPAPRAGT